ncbi:FecR domain-containing protein [Mucilaginibacter sp. SMC90]|uniref:FecR family protein n=1 Tax=Mucilaginibacter sp. SMC90 TaxID=2929803 RepID=UPI001FB1F8DD|nr:FecR family protein [Mucilaginibacter sp. SMC90]UOE47741.1 FecR domain-containing protein [Mucilaginibacter sp. SMC90]
METIVKRLERLYNTENLTPEDKRWLAEYLQGDASELYLVALERFCKDVLEKKIALSTEASGQILGNIHQRIIKPPPVRKVFPLWPLLIKIAVAASVTAVCCAGYIFRKQIDNWLNPVNYQETVALNGEIKLITLPDGTTICLNAGSRLQYPDKFKQSTREVTLTGEAFFKVAHDSRKPFIIHSGKIKTTVLGTSFNVKAYNEDKSIKITVVSGKVGVAPVTSKHPAVLLTSNMQMVYNKASQKLLAEKIDDASAVISWQQGKLQYHNTPLFDVLADVQRKYNVMIRADKNLLNCTLYADFNNMPLEKVLKLMEALVNARFNKEGETYTLKGKGCN